LLVLLVLTIASVNAALGFALAVFLDWRLRLPPPTIIVEGDSEEAAPVQSIEAPVDVAPVDIAPPAEAPVEGVSLEDLPASWQQQLEKSGLTTNSFVEAAVQVLKLDIGEFREHLFRIEEQLQQHLASGDQTAIQALNQEVLALTTGWTTRQADTTQQLNHQSPTRVPYKGVSKRLKGALELQTQSIQDGNAELQAAGGVGPEAFHVLLLRMIDSTHALRDTMHHSLDIILRFENRLENVDRPLLFDRLTSLYNHTGLEVLMRNWVQDNTSGRLLSLAAFDIDNFCTINHEVGGRNGDRVIAAFGQNLDNLRRKHRGYDRTARFGGQMFVLFMGDTGPRNGISAAERIRQTLLGTTFEIDGQTLNLRVSCAVSEVLNSDSPDKIYARLLKGIRAAKAAGGDCTVIDEGGGPVTVEPPVYNMPAQQVTVE